MSSDQQNIVSKFTDADFPALEKEILKQLKEIKLNSDIDANVRSIITKLGIELFKNPAENGQILRIKLENPSSNKGRVLYKILTIEIAKVFEIGLKNYVNVKLEVERKRIE